MRYKTYSFIEKLKIGGILCILLWFFLPVEIILANQTNYLTEENIFSADNDLLYLEFKAKITFSIEWEEYGPTCQQKYPVGTPYDAKLYTYCNRISPDISHLLSDLTLFEENGFINCDKTETFVAGNIYRVYLLDKKSIGKDKATKEQIIENYIEKFSVNGIIDTDIFKIYNNYEDIVYEDSPYYFTERPNIIIIFPPDEAELGTAFEMEIEFAKAENWDRLMIIFEDWDSSSTCPVESDEEFEEEYWKWFNYQSFPYFSDFFTTSTGTTTISVSDLNTGNYNCVRCYFINESTGGISDELCTTYNISVITYIPPEDMPIFYIPIEDWPSYYSEHSTFATSTELFDNWADTFYPVIDWISKIVLFSQDYFEPDTAKAKGEDMGNAVAIGRGYLENIDDFFGGLPISTIFIFYLITALVIIVYRLIKGILTIIVP